MTDGEHKPPHGVSDSDLVAFVEGRLRQPAAARVAEAIAASPELQGEARLIASILQSITEQQLENPPASLVQRAVAIFQHLRAHPGQERWGVPAARHIIAQLLYDSRRGPRLAGVRGGSDRRHLTYGCHLGRLDLQIFRAVHEPGSVVRGQLVPPAGPFEVMVRRSAMGEPVERAQADERSAFRFSVEPGQYDMVLRLGENFLLVPDLSVT